MKHASSIARRLGGIRSQSPVIGSMNSYFGHPTCQSMNTLATAGKLSTVVMRQLFPLEVRLTRSYSGRPLGLPGRGGALRGNICHSGSQCDHISWPATPPRLLSSEARSRGSTGAGLKAQGENEPWKRALDHQIVKIFGTGVETSTGRRVLRKLQRQRVDGKLDQGVQEEGLSDVMLSRALSWLRKRYPLDEDAAMVRRVEREETDMEREHAAKLEEIKNWTPQDRAKVDGIYGGPSAFDQLVDEYEKKKEEKKRKREEAAQERAAQRASSATALARNQAQRSVLDRRKESAEWVQKYKEKAQIIKVLEPEKLSTARRLLPSAAFMTAFVTCCVLFSEYYTGPELSTYMFPNLAPATGTMLMICGANVTLFLAWMLPFCWRKMNQYFLIVTALPRPLSLLGSTFSHQKPVHLLANMVFLWLVGTKLHDQIGGNNFVPLYLACGVLASFTSLSRSALTGSMLQTSLGASGSISAIMAAWLYLNPNAKFTIAFLPEDMSPVITSSFALVALPLLEIFYLSRGKVEIDHWAHLGGYLAGLAGAQVLWSRARSKPSKKDLSDSCEEVSQAPIKLSNKDS